jgi:hypothetical protein
VREPTSREIREERDKRQETRGVTTLSLRSLASNVREPTSRERRERQETRGVTTLSLRSLASNVREPTSRERRERQEKRETRDKRQEALPLSRFARSPQM